MSRRSKLAWRVAHLSDLHVGSRLSVEEFEKIVAQCRSQQAEHLIVTGDITHDEMSHHEGDARAISEILLDYGYSDDRSATVIPGNHDLHGSSGLPGDPCVTARNLPVFWRFFGRFLRRRSHMPRFPIVKRLGRLTFYCLNSICPRKSRWNFRYLFPLHQLKRLARAFRQSGNDPRIIIVHHYPYRIRLGNVRHFSLYEWFEDAFWLPLRGWRKLVGLCARNRVRYILHGHSHSSRIVGFRGTDLVALGQGRTGEGREFSVYDIAVDGSGSRSLIRLAGDGFEVVPSRPIVPELLVDDWVEPGEC